MSKELVLQAATGKGSTIRRPQPGILVADKAAAPSNSKSGYAKGCIWIDRLNGNVYFNAGSITSTTWLKLGFDTSGNLIVTGNLTVTGTTLFTGNATVSAQLLESVENAITAFATGGQASAYALTKMLNRITTCATAGDSVKLPVSVAGMAILVQNDGAASADIFPATGEVINTLAANVQVPLKPGTNVVFYCEVAGTWNVVLPELKFLSAAASGAVTAQAETIFGTNQYTFKAGSIKAGQRIRVRGQGTIGTANGTCQIRVRYGGVGGVLVMDTGNAITPANGDIFTFDLTLSVVDIGAVGHVYGTFDWSIGTAGTGTKRSGKTASIAIDTTSDKVLNVTQQLGTGAGSLTLDYLDVEVK